METKRDHPRVCGEQFFQQKLLLPWIGSPPRVRGTENHIRHGYQFGRITPACAGNSRQWIDRQEVFWDHPRVCGEQCMPCSPRGITKGSPPRVRGTAHVNTSPFPPSRITPACAGNSG